MWHFVVPHLELLLLLSASTVIWRKLFLCLFGWRRNLSFARQVHGFNCEANSYNLLVVNMSCSEVSQLCRSWRCVYWKVFKVSTDEAVGFIQTGTELRALDSEISCRHLSFIRKLSSSPNSVIKRFAKLNLWYVMCILFSCFIVVLYLSLFCIVAPLCCLTVLFVCCHFGEIKIDIICSSCICRCCLCCCEYKIARCILQLHWSTTSVDSHLNRWFSSRLPWPRSDADYEETVRLRCQRSAHQPRLSVVHFSKSLLHHYGKRFTCLRPASINGVLMMPHTHTISDHLQYYKRYNHIWWQSVQCQTPLHGHRLQTCCTTPPILPPTDNPTTILQLVVQQIHHQPTKICHIAMPTSRHVRMLGCGTFLSPTLSCYCLTAV